MAAKIQIKEGSNGKGVFACEDIPKGTPIILSKGKETSSPTRYSIQIEDTKHIDLPENFKEEDPSYFWRYLNHSCSPNTSFNRASKYFIAQQEISLGEQVTFDYTTNEDVMAEPFQCSCTAKVCKGMIKGK